MLLGFMEELYRLEYCTLKFVTYYRANLVDYPCLASLHEGKENYINMKPQPLTLSA